MRLILGLDRPTGGAVTVNGRPYAEHQFPLYEVGALLDAKAVHGGRSALHPPLSASRRATASRKRRVERGARAVGLQDVGRRRIGNYSLGHEPAPRHRGRAAGRPTDSDVRRAGQRPRSRGRSSGCARSSRRLRAEGRTVFVSSHLMSEMALTADHLIVIGRGKLIANAPIDELTGRAAGGRSSYAHPTRAISQNCSAPMAPPSSASTDGALAVHGATAPAYRATERRQRIVLHELTPERVARGRCTSSSPARASSTAPNPHCPPAPQEPPHRTDTSRHHRFPASVGNDGGARPTAPQRGELRAAIASEATKLRRFARRCGRCSPPSRDGWHRRAHRPRARQPLEHHERDREAPLRRDELQLARSSSSRRSRPPCSTISSSVPSTRPG